MAKSVKFSGRNMVTLLAALMVFLIPFLASECEAPLNPCSDLKDQLWKSDSIIYEKGFVIDSLKFAIDYQATQHENTLLIVEDELALAINANSNLQEQITLLQVANNDLYNSYDSLANLPPVVEYIHDTVTVVLNDTVTSTILDTLYYQAQRDSLQELSDSLQYIYDYLALSWDDLTHDYDSMKNRPPDTLIFIPQCTFCYKDTITVDSIEYYVGYDGVHYKIYQDSTVLRRIFFKDTTIIRYTVHDSLLKIPEVALVSIRARGTPCDSIHPNLALYVNGEIFREFSVGTNMYNDYRFVVPVFEEDVTSLEVKFTNDKVNHETEEDRNAWVSDVSINSHPYLTQERVDFDGYCWWLDGLYVEVTMRSNGSIIIDTRR